MYAGCSILQYILYALMGYIIVTKDLESCCDVAVKVFFYQIKISDLCTPRSDAHSFALNLYSKLRVYVAAQFMGDLFQQILYLQEAITNLTAPLGDNDTVTLDDICFKPLAPDNNYCTINSIVQYFQVRIFPHIIRVPCMNLCVCLVITGTENFLLLLRLLAYTKLDDQ